MNQTLLVVFIAVFLISGCQSPAKEKSNSVQNSPVEASLEINVAHAPTSAKTDKDLPPKTAIFPKIESLKGKTKDQVMMVLGKPDFLRIDRPAQLWQYRRKICRIDLFFYPATNNGALTLDFLDFEASKKGDINRQTCFNKIIQARASLNNTR